jgi:hypothetical protein
MASERHVSFHGEEDQPASWLHRRPSYAATVQAATSTASSHITVEQIAELKQTVSALRKDMLHQQPFVDRRQQELEDENINLKIRLRQMEEVASVLREHSDPSLRAELTALSSDSELKQGELLQIRREMVRVEMQLDDARRQRDLGLAEANTLRTQLASARALNEKYFSIKGDLWPLLANAAIFEEKRKGTDISPIGSEVRRDEQGNGDVQLVAGLCQLREAYDQEIERSLFLDSELEAAAKQIAELEHELTRRDQALNELQSGLVSAMQAAEHRNRPTSPNKVRPPSPKAGPFRRQIDRNVQTDPLDDPGIDEKYLHDTTRTEELQEEATQLRGRVEILQAESTQLRGRVEILQAELNGSIKNYESLNRECGLAQDKLSILQDEAVDAHRGREQAAQREEAERRERLIAEQKLSHQSELANQQKKKIENLETHLLNSQLALRDFEIRRLHDTARVEELKAEATQLQRKLEAERQQRRAEKAEEQAHEKIRLQLLQIAPKTALEKRIWDRERRDKENDEKQRFASLECRVEQLEEEKTRDRVLMERRLSEQAKAAAKLSSKMLLERDKLIFYILEVLRGWQTGGRYAPSKVAQCLAVGGVHQGDLFEENEAVIQPFTSQQFGAMQYAILTLLSSQGKLRQLKAM